MNPYVQRLLLTTLLLGGMWQLAEGSWIHAKAWLAQQLLSRAWETSLATGDAVPPWPWADTWPVARLQLNKESPPLIVLHGDSGRTLAFGPGHTPGSALPGQAGNILISAHRDTHFAPLRNLQVGGRLWLETQTLKREFRVEHIEVADSRYRNISGGSEERLVLVTCYPFDAIRPGGHQRFVVTAGPVLQRL